MTPVATGPIFIGGLSGTGKTQLRLALAAHPELSLTRRTRMWDRFYGRFGDLRDPANLDRCLAAMLRDPGVQQLEPDVGRVRRDLTDATPTYAGLFALLHQHYADRGGKRRWGDQLGSVDRFADSIFAAFPTAHMIHMVRDPRHRTSAGRRLTRRARLGWETAIWLQSAELAMRNQWRYAERYLVVHYETFAKDPFGTVEAICSFVDERFVPPMAEAVRGLRFDPCSAEASPPDGLATLSPAAAKFVDRYAGQELARLGYPRTHPVLTGRDRVAFGLTTWPLNRLALAACRSLGAGPAPAGEW